MKVAEPGGERWIEEKGGLNIGPLLPYLAYATLRPDRTRDEHPRTARFTRTRSPVQASNFLKGAWFCHAGCGGGSIRQPLDAEDIWIPNEGHPAFARRR